MSIKDRARWTTSWALYGAGDLVSRWNNNDYRFTVAGFRLYQWLMMKSSDIQGNTELGPWRNPN